MKQGAFFIALFSISIIGCPRYLPPVVFSGNAIIQGEIRKATLTWDRSWNTVLIQVPPVVRNEYMIRHSFSFKETDFTVKKVRITPQLEVYNYTAELKTPQREILITITQQPKNGDTRWPCRHDQDDEIFVVQIKSPMAESPSQKNFRFLARNVVLRSENPLNRIRYKFFPCP